MTGPSHASSAGDRAVRRPRVRAGNVFANMYWMYCDDLRHEEAEHIYHEALAYCDVHDIGDCATFLLGNRAGVFEKLGRWDECVSITHAMLDDQSLAPTGRLLPLSYQAKVMARRGQDGYWPVSTKHCAMQPVSRNRYGCSLCTWHALRRTGWRAVRMRRPRSWIASDMALEASRQSSAVGWHCGNDDSPGLLTQLILSRSPHSSQGMVHGPSNTGIGSATAMRPHWRCWIRRRRPTCVSRYPGLLILVPSDSAPGAPHYARSWHPRNSCWCSYRNKGTPPRPHRTRATDSPTHFRRSVQRGDLSHIVHFRQDRRTPRIRDSRQTRRVDASGRGQGGATVGPAHADYVSLGTKSR